LSSQAAPFYIPVRRLTGISPFSHMECILTDRPKAITINSDRLSGDDLLFVHAVFDTVPVYLKPVHDFFVRCTSIFGGCPHRTVGCIKSAYAGSHASGPGSTFF
jgi:hypothetical protein